MRVSVRTHGRSEAAIRILGAGVIDSEKPDSTMNTTTAERPRRQAIRPTKAPNCSD